MPLEDLPQPIKDHIFAQCNQDDYEPMQNCYSITEVLYCLRKCRLKRTNPHKPITDLKTANNFYRGNTHDRNFTSLFKRNQIRCTYRCRNVPRTVSGKFDFIDENGILTDLKSPASLYYVKQYGISSSYTKQIIFYCYNNSIPQGQYLGYDGGDALKIPIDVSEEKCREVINEVEGRVAILFASEQTGKLPTKAQSTPEKWECPCEYSEYCESEGQSKL